jgi:hypothetical protein
MQNNCAIMTDDRLAQAAAGMPKSTHLKEECGDMMVYRVLAARGSVLRLVEAGVPRPC